MNNNDRILDVFLNLVKEKYKDDVCLVCCYGSYVTGTATEKSDVDFYFVPKTDRAWELVHTFIIDGIGYDFWGVTWERLEKMAAFEDTFVSLVDGAKIIYSNSAEDEDRFNKQKQFITDTVNAPVNIDMLSKAQNHIDAAEKCYFTLISNDNAKDKRLNAGMILLEISDAVCLMNNSFLRFGTKKHLEELSRLKHLPNGFVDNYKKIVNAKQNADIKNACFDLIMSARQLQKDLLDKVSIIKEPKECLSGLYEEISSNWNKLYKACDEGNADLAFITGVFLQDELDSVLGECDIEQIDIISEYDSDSLPAYKEAAMRAEKMFLSYLKEYQVPINQYESVSDLENALLIDKQ